MSTSTSTKIPNQKQESLEEEIYEVESLEGHRMSLKYKGAIDYLIKWKDYDPINNSWENEKNIFSKGLVLEYWKKQPYTYEQFRDGSYNQILQQKALKAAGVQEVVTSPPIPIQQKTVVTTASTGAAAAAVTKKRPSPSTVMLDIMKRQKITDIRNAQITAEPPKGLTWSDIVSVENVFHCGKSTYFAEVRWDRSEETISFIPTRIIRKHNPLKLIHFYEKYLDFYVSPSQDIKQGC